jgi:DNA (cytosine-5)-methyltransferase 1
MEIRYIELFAGIGGFRYGLEKANDTITERTQQRIQQESKSNDTIVKPFLGTKQFSCVWANEWTYDPYKKEKCWAWKIYQKQFGEKELNTRDICDVPAETIPDHEMLTAGFPCPSYSIAGKRKGFKDPRGIVFFEICRIAKVKRPQLLLLENVKGLLNHDEGRTFAIILSSLSELGYDLEWEVFNSKNYAVPQHRERVYIIGHLRGTGGQKVFPLGSTMQEDNESDERQTSGCIKPGEGRNQNHGTFIIKKTQWDTSGKGHKSQQDRAYKTNGIICSIPSDRSDNKLNIIMNTLTEATGTRQGSSKEFLKSVDNINDAIGQIRRLTPTECERLQGFPDGWTEGISDTQRYKCLGNAVTVNVITEIGKRIARVSS